MWKLGRVKSLVVTGWAGWGNAGSATAAGMNATGATGDASPDVDGTLALTTPMLLDWLGNDPIRPLSGFQLGSLAEFGSGAASTGPDDGTNVGMAPGNRGSGDSDGPGGIGIGAAVGMGNIVIGGASGVTRPGLALPVGVAAGAVGATLPLLTVP